MLKFLLVSRVSNSVQMCIIFYTATTTAVNFQGMYISSVVLLMMWSFKKQLKNGVFRYPGSQLDVVTYRELSHSWSYNQIRTSLQIAHGSQLVQRRTPSPRCLNSWNLSYKIWGCASAAVSDLWCGNLGCLKTASTFRSKVLLHLRALHFSPKPSSGLKKKVEKVRKWVKGIKLMSWHRFALCIS